MIWTAEVVTGSKWLSRTGPMYKPAAALEAALQEQWGGPVFKDLKAPWLDGLTNGSAK